jgi:hypothetical protein
LDGQGPDLAETPVLRMPGGLPPPRVDLERTKRAERKAAPSEGGHQRREGESVLFGQIYAGALDRGMAPSPQVLETVLRERVRDLLEGRWQGVAPRVSVS